MAHGVSQAAQQLGARGAKEQVIGREGLTSQVWNRAQAIEEMLNREEAEASLPASIGAHSYQL